MNPLPAFRRPASRLLLALAVLVGLLSAVILVQGGWRFDIGGIRVSMTSPWRAALVALFCFILYLRWSPVGERDADARRLVALGSRPTAVAVVLSVAVFGAGWFWGSRVGGGADSSGYLNQAQLWRQGTVVIDHPLIAGSQWPFASQTWAPLGFRPAARKSDALVPLYPPGLPLLMAAAQSIAGFCAAFLIVPLFGALTIWLTCGLGRRLFDSPSVGACGALLVATSPVFLFQLLNPMSDVPVTAAWTLATILAIDRRPLGAGLAAALAIAIRPNLAPLGLVLLAWTAAESRNWRPAIRLALGMAPGVIGIAALNAYLYGSPFRAGYGSAADLYSLAYVATNLRHYGWLLLTVETPLLVLAALFFIAPAFVGPTRLERPRLLLGGIVAVLTLSYLFYKPFEDWTYLRFFMPMWPILMVLSAAGVFAVVRRWKAQAVPLVPAACVVFAALLALDAAAAREVFGLWRDERRYVDVARFVESRIDPQAVLVSLQHSGSLRLYTGRLTLRYDVVEPHRLDLTIEFLRSIGRRTYFVLDTWELEAFRTRFASASRRGALDWDPMAALPRKTWIFDADPGRAADTVEIASSTDGRLFCHVPSSER